MKTPTDRSTWILLAVGVAAAAAYVEFVFLPQRRAIAQLRGELSTKQAYVAGMANADAMIQATRKNLEKTSKYDAAWGEQAAAGKDVARLFGEISAVATAAGATTTRFDPEPIVVCGTLRKIPLTMGCRGTYGQLHKLLANLEALPATIWIKHVDLEKAERDTKDIQAEVNLVIFADNPDDSDQVDHTE